MRVRAIPSSTSSGSLRAPSMWDGCREGEQLGVSGGLVFCVQHTIWDDSGERFQQLSQRTKGCSCNILPTEKHTSRLLRLRLHGCSPLLRLQVGAVVERTLSLCVVRGAWFWGSALPDSHMTSSSSFLYFLSFLVG